jgi:hypothetical protein
VTSGALIVFLVFASMATTDEVDVKVLATGFAAAVLLDALLVPLAAGAGDRLPAGSLELMDAGPAAPLPAGAAGRAFCRR